MEEFNALEEAKSIGRGKWTAGRRENSGLTEDEAEVMNSLVEAWNKYTELERMHYKDLDEFAAAIHTAQYLLGIRILRRQYPKYWIKATRG